jgi:hypothetical protein
MHHEGTKNTKRSKGKEVPAKSDARKSIRRGAFRLGGEISTA